MARWLRCNSPLSTSRLVVILLFSTFDSEAVGSSNSVIKNKTDLDCVDSRKLATLNLKRHMENIQVCQGRYVTESANNSSLPACCTSSSVDRTGNLPIQNKTQGKEENLPKLTRIDPVKVGYVRELNLIPGKVHKMKTLSLRPALFEIEDFLTAQECDDIMFMAQTQGLQRSMTLGESVDDDEDSTNRTLARLLPDDPMDAFQELDVNSDSHLDSAEISIGLMELGRVIVNQTDTEKMISDLDMDPNKDGVISYHEFLKIIVKRRMRDMIYYLEKLYKTRPNKRARDSSTAFLDPYEHVDFKPLFERLRDRIHEVTKLPKDMIWSSENMQVIKYTAKQHYHCHFDSEGEEKMQMPCCHQLDALEEDYEGDCVPCRFLTFFYYLNEPEEGGETAFPIADNDTLMEKDRMKVEEMHRCDLSEHCHEANLYYKPKRGAALLWYNHFVSEETGWLGPVDVMSYHGGCNVIQGTKWAANNWINAGSDRQADLDAWEVGRLVEEDFQERMKRNPWEQQTGSERNVEEGG